MAYSIDLRTRVLAAIDGGMKQCVAEGIFQVGHSTITRWLTQRKQTGSLAARPIPGRPRAIGAAETEALRAQLLAQPDATLDSHVASWQHSHQRRLSQSTMSRAIRRLDWTRKKSRSAPANKTRSAAPRSARGSKRTRQKTS